MSNKLVAVVLSIALKLGNEDGMALKTTWEVKDGGGMGVRTHVLGGECPSVTQTELNKAGPGSEDFQRPFLETSRAREAGKNDMVVLKRAW